MLWAHKPSFSDFPATLEASQRALPCQKKAAYLWGVSYLQSVGELDGFSRSSTYWRKGPFLGGRISPSYTHKPRMKCIILDKSRLLEIPGEEKIFFKLLDFHHIHCRSQKSEQQPEYFLTENLKSLSSVKLIEKRNNIFKVLFSAHFIIKYCSVILQKALWTEYE